MIDESSALYKALSLPFDAALRLNVPEQSLNKLIHEFTKGKVEISDFHCHAGYVSCGIKKGILPRINVEVGIEQITLNQTECILLLKDRKGNLVKLINLLGFFGVSLPLKPYHENHMSLDFTRQWTQKKKGQPKAILTLLDTLTIKVDIVLEEARLEFAVQQE